MTYSPQTLARPERARPELASLESVGKHCRAIRALEGFSLTVLTGALRRPCVGILMLAAATGAVAVEPEISLQIEVSGVVTESAGSGPVSVSVYEEDGFLRRPLLTQQVDPVEERFAIELPMVFGTYCVVAFQDTIGNGRLDRNFVGIPKEPIGFSRGYIPKFGPPKFSGCRFVHDGEGDVRVRLATP